MEESVHKCLCGVKAHTDCHRRSSLHYGVVSIMFVVFHVHTCDTVYVCGGKDFRKDFKRVGEIRALVDVPFMALTASAPPQVQADITNTLHLCSPVSVSCCLDRPNVYISASPITSLNVSDINVINQWIVTACHAIIIIERFIWVFHQVKVILLVFLRLSCMCPAKTQPARCIIS